MAKHKLLKKEINRPQKFLAISLVGIILILILSIFLIDKPRIKYAKYPTAKYPTIARKLTPSISPDPITIKDTASPFQKYLIEKCKPVFHQEDYGGGWYAYEIENKDLPFAVNDSKFPKKVWQCMFTGKQNYSGERDGSGYLKYEDWNYFVYDDESVEAGHGGYPGIGKPGPLIKNSNNVSIRFVMNFEGPAVIQYLEITGRFTKELSYNGKPIFLNVFVELFPDHNQRLMDLLDKYSKEESVGREMEKVVDWDKISSDQFDQLIKNEFFSDMNNLPEPQKKAIKETEALLESITSI